MEEEEEQGEQVVESCLGWFVGSEKDEAKVIVSGDQLLLNLRG